MNFCWIDGKFEMLNSEQLNFSILASMGNVIAPIFKPLGWENWKMAIAAYSFLIFNLLCAPCFAAMGAIKREMNNTKWFLETIAYQSELAYIVSLCIYQIGTLITKGVFGVGTIAAFIVGVVLAGVLFIIIKEMYMNKKKGKSIVGCDGNCENCGGSCH